jgi:hypothetical protein
MRASEPAGEILTLTLTLNVVKGKGTGKDLEPELLLSRTGGRGRNRTFNLSVKSRMLCQLSYASSGLKSRARGFLTRPAGERECLPHLEKYTTDAGDSQGAALPDERMSSPPFSRYRALRRVYLPPLNSCTASSIATMFSTGVPACTL